MARGFLMEIKIQPGHISSYGFPRAIGRRRRLIPQMHTTLSF
jgi:hypothetical protein